MTTQPPKNSKIYSPAFDQLRTNLKTPPFLYSPPRAKLFQEYFFPPKFCWRKSKFQILHNLIQLCYLPIFSWFQSFHGSPILIFKKVWLLNPKSMLTFFQHNTNVDSALQQNSIGFTMESKGKSKNLQPSQSPWPCISHIPSSRQFFFTLLYLLYYIIFNLFICNAAQ